ncbi:MAG: response regulator [Myxococcales bacterium]|nr:response regulator [Myxococcales bacterium]
MAPTPDVGVPGVDGVELLRELKRAKPDLEVVLVTVDEAVPRAVNAMKEGAYDYLREPFEPDEALMTVVRAAERKSLRERARSLTALVGSAGKARRTDRQERRHAARLRSAGAGLCDRRDRTDHGRKGDREGAGGPGGARELSPRLRAFRARGVRRHLGPPDRVRAVRARPRRVLHEH